MKLPYTWRPEGAQTVWLGNIEVGMLIAYEHEVWRVVAIHELDPANVKPGRPVRAVQLRPASSDSTMTATSEDIHLSGSSFKVFASDHYPVCVKCLKPLPCPEQMTERIVAAETRRNRCYEMPGVCPSCEEPVTQRQPRQTWPDNLVVPNGQPVTFHLRQRCVDSAVSYDEKWRAAGHESLLGFDPDAEAVERMLSELDGRDKVAVDRAISTGDWGQVADARGMRRYASRIPPKLNLRPNACGWRLEGCLGKVTHTGGANGLALTGGCERCIGRWVEDPEVRPTQQQPQACPSAHLHVDHLTPAQRRIGLDVVKCGCRRGVKRLEQPASRGTRGVA